MLCPPAVQRHQLPSSVSDILAQQPGTSPSGLSSVPPLLREEPVIPLCGEDMGGCHCTLSEPTSGANTFHHHAMGEGSASLSGSSRMKPALVKLVLNNPGIWSE